MAGYKLTPERAVKDLKYLRILIDEYIEFAVRMEIPDAMTPLIHMRRDLGRLDTILGVWNTRDHDARREKWRQIATEKDDVRGNR